MGKIWKMFNIVFKLSSKFVFLKNKHKFGNITKNTIGDFSLEIKLILAIFFLFYI